jgi:membrane dipeptidase
MTPLGGRWPISDRARNLHEQALVCDLHGCMPLRPDVDLSELSRYRLSGANYISINVGFDIIPWPDIVRILAHFRAWILARPEDYVLAATVADVRRAFGEGKLAVVFDLEGADALAGQISMIPMYYDLGVRSLAFAYNKTNGLAGGCADTDPGLTQLGRRAVSEMNRVGMLIDCSHVGARSSLEIIALSSQPVVFTHSNPAALLPHVRNITDEQIKACAATRGVVGIVGSGRFLAEDGRIRPETFVRHIDYIAQLVGVPHVALGIDCVFDVGELDDWIKAFPEYFPPAVLKTRGQPERPKPELLPEITEGMVGLGYSDKDIRAVLGENFLRVASSVWK